MWTLKSRTVVRSVYHRFNLSKYFSSPAQAPHQPAILNVNIDVNSKQLNLALKPREVVEQLDKFIVGQKDAKRAVAIALRNRWRRHQLPDDMKNEVIPKNILMIGPTGCGKTEIARRIAKLSQAPFIKVEATKYTEVGFHGRDVDSIIRDLLDVSINMTKKRIKEEIKAEVDREVEAKLLDHLIGPTAENREHFSQLLRNGDMNEQSIMIDLPRKNGGGGKGSGAIVFDPSSAAVQDLMSDVFKKVSLGKFVFMYV